VETIRIYAPSASGKTFRPRDEKTRSFLKSRRGLAEEIIMSLMQVATLAAQAAADSAPSEFGIMLKLWLKSIGWALAGGLGMGFGLVLSLKIFTVLTRDVDEWAEVKKNNLGMSIILSSVVLGTSLVIMMSMHG
jgi:hypothetical protein